MLDSLVRSTFDAQYSVVAAPVTAPHLHPGRSKSRCDLGRGATRSPPLGVLSVATSTHTKFPAIPPKGLIKAVPGCWSSQGAKGPSYAGEKPPMAPNR